MQYNVKQPISGFEDVKDVVTDFAKDVKDKATDAAKDVKDAVTDNTKDVKKKCCK